MRLLLPVYAYLLGGVAGVSIYWSRSVLATLAMSSIYVGMCGVAATAVTSVVVDLFPTSMRSMTLSLTLMMGEVGATIGNILFPILLDLSCVLPFFLLGGVVLGIVNHATIDILAVLTQSQNQVIAIYDKQSGIFQSGNKTSLNTAYKGATTYTLFSQTCASILTEA